MTTTSRFYFASTTAAAVSPAFDSDWGVTAAAVRRKLKTAPAASGSSGSVAAAEVSASVVDVLNGQFISDSDVLPLGPLAGTFDLVMSCRASGSGAADMYLQMRLHVYDAAGTTKRGTIYDGQAFGSVSATAADPNGEFAFAAQDTRFVAALALIPGTTVQAGDRLVVEVGARACNVSTTSRTSTLDFRDDAVADHALAAGLTANGRPWLEVHLTNAPGIPTALAIDPADTTADLDWGVPATGDPATGYRVRLNGGAATDVGNVLTHTYVGLASNTAYNTPGAEVQAYNAGGSSGWASIAFTTDDASPGVPTGLTATGETDTAVDLDWVAPGGPYPATGYEYRIDGGAAVDVGNVLGLTVSGLTASTTYTVEVRAYNASGVSTWSAPVGFTTEAGDPPPDPGDWVAEIVIGGYSWEIHNSDEPAEYGPLAGLRFGWSRGAEELAHPDHEWATIGIIAVSADDLADLDDDDPVAVRLWFPTVLGDPVPGPPEDCLFSFYGRVADMTCEPHDLGAVFTVNAVGYTVDIAEAQIGGVPLLEYVAPDYQTPLDWARTALAEVGLVLEDGPAPATVMEGDREPQFTEGWGLVRGLFRQSPMGRFGSQLLPLLRTFYANPTVTPAPPLEPAIAWPGWFFGFGAGALYGLPVLHAYATDEGLGRADGVHFGYDVLDKRNDTSIDAPPGIAEWADGEVVITIDPAQVGDSSAGVGGHFGAIDGALIETDSTRWRRAKDDRPTEVIVARGADVYGYARRPAPMTISERVENLTSHPHRAAAALLPDAGEFTDWGAEVYRYRLSDDPYGLPAMLPNHADHTPSGSDERARLFNRPLAVTNIAARHNPNTDPWVAGRLLGAEVTIDGDEVHLDFALSRTVPRQVAPYTGGPALQGFTVAMWGDLVPRPAVSDLSHSFSVDDYRLVRNPNA